MAQIKVTATNTEKRVHHRQATMPAGEQFEAVLDMARQLKLQGYDVGLKMDAIIAKDDAVRSKYKRES